MLASTVDPEKAIGVIEREYSPSSTGKPLPSFPSQTTSWVPAEVLPAGNTSAGTHEVVWDGKDGNGFPVEDGEYSLSITPIAFSGSTVDASTRIYAKVTGVSMINGTTLDASGVSIALDQIDTVKEQKSTSG